MEVVAPYGQISADEMWERVQYFYERVIPVAEEAGVNVGAHPDDPPERHYRGVEQILNNIGFAWEMGYIMALKAAAAADG